ncbi:MAG: allantoicase [Gammaproteobacteria bacterium]|nr:allantoicase [Gammaproteobacteria bacterium]
MNDFATRWVNLASAKLGAQAVRCSDDFFAPMARMLQDAAPVFIDGKYDDHGKWMDGWESRRKRDPGHDWCVVKLARPGVIRGVDIDTTHFTGNYPPAASLEGCFVDGDGDGDDPGDADWFEVIARVDLRGDNAHAFEVDAPQVFTHVRLNIYPDGGVARLRVYGEPKVDWVRLTAAADDGLVDLAAALNGAVALVCNDEHFGTMRNLLTPGRGVDMGDGWETRRRRAPGNDWVIIALAHAGTVKKVEVDTAHFKGNYPDRCSLQGARLDASAAAADDIAQHSESWAELLPQVKLEADREHQFESQVNDLGAVTHVRLNIYPDGGVSRLRLFGTVDNGDQPEDAK